MGLTSAFFSQSRPCFVPTPCFLSKLPFSIPSDGLRTRLNYCSAANQYNEPGTKHSTISQHDVPPSYVRPRFGPRNSISNIRPVYFDTSGAQTNLQLSYRAYFEETWKWMENHWTDRNKRLLEAKNQFLKSIESKDIDSQHSLPSDLSAFHTKFLIDNQPQQLRFNFEWYRRILFLTYLGMLVELEYAAAHLRYQWKSKRSGITKT